MSVYWTLQYSLITYINWKKMLPDQREIADKTTLSLTSCQGPPIWSHWQLLGSCMTDLEKKSDSFSVALFKGELKNKTKQQILFMNLTSLAVGSGFNSFVRYNLLLCSSLLSLRTSKNSIPLKFLLKRKGERAKLVGFFLVCCCC